MDKQWEHFSNKLRQLFSLRRTKYTLYIVIVLWVAVGTQMLMNRFFREEFRITEAFVKSDTEEIQSSIEIIAEYQSGYLSKEEKEKVIYSLADEIGLTIDDDILLWEEHNRSECYFFKQAKQASSEIKIVSIQQEGDSALINNYIITRIIVKQGIESIDKYKQILEKAFHDLKVKDKQITLQFEGNREGNLSNTQKHEMAKLLVEELQGEIAIEYDEGDLYTVYAYTGMLNEYIISMGNKINIQIAITYNELTNKTRITMATPILNDSW